MSNFSEVLYAAASSGTQAFTPTTVEQDKDFSLDIYAGDTWQLAHNLTLTYGVRATQNSNPINRLPLIANWNDFTTFTHANLNGGSVSAPPNANFAASNKLWNSVPLEVWQPRFALAWQPRANTLVKAGWGMFSQVAAASAASTLERNAPFNPTFVGGFGRGNLGANGSPAGCTLNGGSDPQCGFLWAPGPGSAVAAAQVGNQRFQANFANGAASCVATGPSLTCVPQVSVSALPRAGLNAPVTYQYNLTVQQQVGRNLSVSAGYVGTRSQHLSYTYNDNGFETVCPGCFSPFVFATSSSGAPDPRFNNYNQTRYDGYSRYDSLQSNATERLTHGLTLNFNYTWSHCLSTGTPYQDGSGSNLRAVYASCGFDITHVANASYTYQLPFRTTRSGLGWLVNDWQVSGSTFAQGGHPLFMTMDGGASLGGNLVQTSGPRGFLVAKNTPLYAKNQNLAGVTAVDSVQWVNSNAFFTPFDPNTGNCFNATGLTEDSAPNATDCQFTGNNGAILRGPGFQWSNLDLAKTVRLTERVAMACLTGFGAPALTSRATTSSTTPTSPTPTPRRRRARRMSPAPAPSPRSPRPTTVCWDRTAAIPPSACSLSRQRSSSNLGVPLRERLHPQRGSLSPAVVLYWQTLLPDGRADPRRNCHPRSRAKIPSCVKARGLLSCPRSPVPMRSIPELRTSLKPLLSLLSLALVASVASVGAAAQARGNLAQQRALEALRIKRQAIENQLEQVAVIDRKVMVKMRDGKLMAADVYRPKNATGKVPIIFVRTPYNFNFWDVKNGTYRDMSHELEAVQRGYAYVEINERGHFFSQGNYDILGPPLSDGSDEIKWMSTQPWANGRVGTTGCSSTAEWQLGVVAQNDPGLTTFNVQGFGAGVGRVGPYFEQGNWYRGGAVQMLFIDWLYGEQNQVRPMFPQGTSQSDLILASKMFDLAPQMPPVDWNTALWHLPEQDIIRAVDGPRGIFATKMPVATGGNMIARTPNDPAWYKGGLWNDAMPVKKPGLWFMSWFDVSVSPNLAAYNFVRRTAPPAIANEQYAIIAPVLHCAYTRATANTMIGDLDVGDARLDYDSIIYGWFDHFLKGENNGILSKQPKVMYYVMGENKWKNSPTWPPPGAKAKTFYLDSVRGANSASGDGSLLSGPPAADHTDAFTYDPAHPVTTFGGGGCCEGNAVKFGSYDQNAHEADPNILVYNSEPFTTGTEVSGPITVTLYVSSDAKDTDFTFKVMDVHPDGKAFNITENIQRMRYRDGYTKPEVWMTPGKVYKVTFQPIDTSIFFAPGHRLRLAISSSNFPRFDRNLNTGGKNYDESRSVIAHNAVHHGPQYPSQITLTVVPNR